MKQILLSFRVSGKKDLVLIRQRTRQLAALLGYGAHDQAILAAGVFHQACQIHRCKGRTTWIFSVADRHLGIFPAGDNTTVHCSIVKPLPEKALLSPPEIGWVIQELGRLTPLDVFAEIKKLNQELLDAILEGALGKVRPSRSAA